MTHGEFLGWIYHITEGGDLGSGATVNDYIQWATDNGLSPNGGWKPNKKLTKKALAQTLVQLWKLNPKKYSGDYERNLLREGIELPDNDEITRQTLIETVDQFGFQSKVFVQSKSRGSGVNGDNGHPGNIPPPGFRNPNNPHYNDGDPLPPGSANGKGGNNRDKRR